MMRSVKSCFSCAVLFALLFASDVLSDVVRGSDNSDYSVDKSDVFSLKLISQVKAPPNALKGNETRYECGSSCANDRVCKYVPEARKKYCECRDESLKYSASKKCCVTTCQTDSDCGSLGDRRCAFDPELKKSCQCKDEAKTYSSWHGLCLIPCEYDKCGDGGCALNAGDYEKFCSCPKGFSGDTCNVDDCFNMCGKSSIDVKCNFDHGSSTPVCSCTNPKHGFDYDSKTCKDCDCGGPHYRCEYREGEKVCICPPSAYMKDGHCEDCKCGEQGTGCQLGTSGEKICSCQWEYANNNGVCKSCDCGGGSAGCTFQNDKKFCYCQDGYSHKNETICSPCDCGPGEKCLFDKENKKVCDCNPGYAESLGKCSECECGENGNCSINFMKICSCNSGYQVANTPSDKNMRCKKCDCGDHGNCSFISFGEHKSCNCEEGYSLNGTSGFCEECDCGVNGNCYFSEGKKNCYCNDGYASLNGSCKECKCGSTDSYHHCTFNDNGEQECLCENEYALRLGECESCEDCHDNTYYTKKCTFDEKGDRFCSCPTFKASYNGTCKDCECGLNTAGCNFTENTTECFCMSGYKKVNGSCEDIDECFVKEKPCDYSNTICVNTPGSYQCDCKSGYKKAPNNYLSEHPESAQCFYDTWPFKIAGIVIGVVLSAIGTGISAYIYIKRKRAAATTKVTNDVVMSRKF